MDLTITGLQKLVEVAKHLVANKEKIFNSLKLEIAKNYHDMKLDLETLVLSNIDQDAAVGFISIAGYDHTWNELMLLIIQNRTDFTLDEFNNLWKLILFIEFQSDVVGDSTSILGTNDSRSTADNSSKPVSNEKGVKLIINTGKHSHDILKYVETGWELVLSKLEQTFNLNNSNKSLSAKVITTILVNMTKHNYFSHYLKADNEILIQNNIFHKKITPSVILLDYCYNHNQLQKDYSIGCNIDYSFNYQNVVGIDDDLHPCLTMFCADLNSQDMEQQVISNIEINSPNLKAGFLNQVKEESALNLQEKFESKKNTYLINQIIGRMIETKSNIDILTDSHSIIIISIPKHLNIESLNNAGTYDEGGQYHSFDIEGFILTNDHEILDLNGDLTSMNNFGLNLKAIMCSLISNYMQYIQMTSNPKRKSKNSDKKLQLDNETNCFSVDEIVDEIHKRKENLSQLGNITHD
ncbi:hypothetical protein BN7_394 [Wickerhamomyces ciferrii]|uniref:Uncharacterized protein n=1 Tax=Wickerhamomyces ciferrii (strain ATCC 14091 / BCRC 22168 / CBS 111 / JCM 3599 / NBRC 0793 / NRRL Y-1031 F-60-10) TaxID=1206466 RepID=K0K7R9_WICCF|nr:uncharacterized protein BN7_394 [Wickerhamomyces ciferrii]CCH40860.1 hypothetical protein BN7_394 [Wickerhamomyces ciferrii]